MAVTLTGVQGFFTRHGAWIGEYNRVALLYGSALDAGFQSIWAQYPSSDQAAVQQLPDAVTAFRLSGSSYQATLAADGVQSSLLQVNRDTALVPYTLPQAIQTVHDQMVTAVASINRPTLGSTVAAGGSNLGNTKFFVSTTNVHGDPLDTTLAETFTAVCTSQGSGFTASFSVVGQPSVPASAWNWPQGSGAQATVSVLDPAVSGILTNGSFETFTVADTPDGWTINNGAAGVTVFESVAGGTRTGTNAVYLQSDGAQATQLSQQVTLSPNTVYAVTFCAKMNTGSVSGSAVVRLTNAAGTTLLNDAGTALSQTYTLNGGGGQIGTSYDLYTVFFSTPRQLPSAVYLHVGYNAAGVSTRQLFLDQVQIVAAQPLYGLAGTGTSGPFVVGVANTAASSVNDTYSIAFTNSLTTKSFALGLERLYSLRELGVYVPSSVSPTIPDSLVTN